MLAKKIYSILHVDDDKMFLDMVSLMLKDTEFKLDFAYNGEDAVTKAFRNQYDIIIMDIMMPVMDGKTASKTIKRMIPKVPIMALTAFDVNDLNSYSIDHAIRKPVTKEVLIKNIKILLDKFK